MLAVEVKDGVTYHHYPADVQRALDDLGEDRTQGLYERAVDEFWTWVQAAAWEHGFTHAYAEGHSSGWLAVGDTQGWEDEEVINPQTDEARANQKRFLELAFEAQQELGSCRENFFTYVREAHRAWSRRPASYSVVAFPIREDGRSLDAIAECTAEDAVTCFATIGRHCERWINDPDRYQWEAGHEPQIDLTLTWKPRIDPDTLAALREVAAGKLDQFSVGELEDIGLSATSQAGRTDDDALMRQAEQILEAHNG